MKRDFFVNVDIADCHIGNRAISPKEYKYQLKNGVIKKLKDMPFIDMICILGDLSHYQMSMNSEYAIVYQWFVSQIVKIAKVHNAIVRVIKGTKSHDLDQLETLRQYEDEFDVDFKIINEVYTEEVNGYNFAYIPEEYINKPIEVYYKDIFDKPDGYFDMIFGHGTIEQTRFKEQSSENIDSNAPVFNLKDLYRVCKGPIKFGHIHTPMVFHNKFYYVGSTLRTAHGEEEDKGFNITVYIKKKGVYRVDKIVNEFTFKFKELKMSDEVVRNNEADILIDRVESYIKDHNVDKLFLKVTCVETPESTVKIELLKKYFSKNKDITTSFKVMNETQYVKDELTKKERKTKPYFKDGLTMTERVKLWALENRNRILEEDQINKFLTMDSFKRKGV